MPEHWTPGHWKQRGARLLAVVLALAAGLGQCSCTSLSDWAHNCFKVGPNYHRPPVPLPSQWVDAGDPKVRHGDPNLCSWWDVFDDPILNKLLHEAFAHNLTIKAAGFQILQAKQLECIALGELMPQTQTAILGFTRNESSLTGGSAGLPTATAGTGLSPSPGLAPVAPPNTPIAGLVDPGTGTTTTGTASPTTTGATPTSGFGANRFSTNIATTLNASWELDFWGLFRRNLEAADANLDQSVFNYDEMLVLLLASVATKYVEIRTFQRRLELARTNVAFQDKIIKTYYEGRFKGEFANSKPEYLQLRANLENTRALIPQLEIGLRQTNNQLCVLLGQPVHDLLPLLGDGTVPDPKDPSKRMVRIPRPRDEAVVLGIPAKFLLRRPDVLSAEAQLRIQSAQIGIAEAEMYPHIGINGTIGLASSHLATLFDARSWVGSIGPSMSWNILNYGRLLANVRGQNFLYNQFVAQYQQALLNANLDAENALIAYLQSITQAEHLRLSAEDADSAVTYYNNQIKPPIGYIPPAAQGNTGAFANTLFTLFNFLVTQQDSAAQAQGNIALNLILLYRAMGGGWQIRLEQGPCLDNQVLEGPELPPPPPDTKKSEAMDREVEQLPPPKRFPMGDPN
jgi:NodT family efflux transporter outer membrane factor (OMF) lipoprotein